MNILSLVPEPEEQQFSRFIDCGLARIKSNREFCGLVRNILTVQFEPMMSSHKLVELETYQEHFNELLEKYLEHHWQSLLKEYLAQINDQITEQQIEAFESRQLANF